MADVNKAKPNANKNIIFVGRGWKNTVAKEGPNKGKEFISLRLDREIENITLTHADQITLWPNNKREGRNDADYRVSIATQTK